jgi:hypothetical protein
MLPRDRFWATVTGAFVPFSTSFIVPPLDNDNDAAHFLIASIAEQAENFFLVLRPTDSLDEKRQ